MSSDRRKRSPPEIISHARRRIALIRAWTSLDTMETYLANEERQHAVERDFIGIGEAIKELGRTVDLLSLDPTGPWREPARFRDFLAHQYEDGVSHPDVWRTIQEDLPILDEALDRIGRRLPAG
jgi:uncharacterized protein with HEPN domain